MRQADQPRALGLIAGAGQLPIEAARLLRAEGESVSAVGFEGLTEPGLAGAVEAIRWVRLGRLAAMAEAMGELGFQRVMLIGKVPKALLFEDHGLAEPDPEALRVLREQRDRGDEALLGAIARWLEEQGFRLCNQDELLAPMLASVGPLSGRSPSASELADLGVGLPIVQQLGLLGVGQCVVVKHGSVLAVEAIEGTDSVIARAGALGGPGATVIKASRPGQDRRFDLPAVGVGTIHAICAAGASGLAIEAGSTLMVGRKSMIEAADLSKIAVWGFASARTGS